MDYKSYREPQLRELLGRFVSRDLLPDKVVEVCDDYLFKKGALPFFVETELFETVFYLKDVMMTNDLESLEDVLSYYQELTNDVNKFIEQYHESQQNMNLSESIPLILKTFRDDIKRTEGLILDNIIPICEETT